MTIINYAPLVINGKVVQYEGKIKVQRGSRTRVANPQVNGSIIYTSDISTDVSKITVSVRVTPQSNALFASFYNNGDNNVMSVGDENFSRATMEVLPETEDQEIAEYMFYTDTQTF